ncbi:MAG TPA: galactose-1-phosphate uridylyltransferase, partial [Gordonia polyisoprenivorans]|nr:galactose-1-phosphate uridylyltransferase [Gordonia polyisoprenivorans]
MSGVDGNQSGWQPHSSGRPLHEPVRGALADGREILFFSTESASRPGTDHRDLPPRPTDPPNEIRRD